MREFKRYFFESLIQLTILASVFRQNIDPSYQTTNNYFNNTYSNQLLSDRSLFNQLYRHSSTSNCLNDSLANRETSNSSNTFLRFDHAQQHQFLLERKQILSHQTLDDIRLAERLDVLLKSTLPRRQRLVQEKTNYLNQLPINNLNHLFIAPAAYTPNYFSDSVSESDKETSTNRSSDTPVITDPHNHLILNDIDLNTNLLNQQLTKEDLEMDYQMQQIIEQDIDIGITKSIYFENNNDIPYESNADEIWKKQNRQFHDFEASKDLKHLEKDFLEKEKESDLLSLMNIFQNSNVPDGFRLVVEEDTGEWMLDSVPGVLDKSTQPVRENHTNESASYTNTTNAKCTFRQKSFNRLVSNDFGLSSFCDQEDEQLNEPANNNQQKEETTAVNTNSEYYNPDFFFCHPDNRSMSELLFQLPSSPVYATNFDSYQTNVHSGSSQEMMQRANNNANASNGMPPSSSSTGLDDFSDFSIVDFTLPPLFSSQKSIDDIMINQVDSPIENLVETFNQTNIFNGLIEMSDSSSNTAPIQSVQASALPVVQEETTSAVAINNSVEASDAYMANSLNYSSVLKSNVSLTEPLEQNVSFNDEFFENLEQSMKKTNASNTNINVEHDTSNLNLEAMNFYFNSTYTNNNELFANETLANTSALNAANASNQSLNSQVNTQSYSTANASMSTEAASFDLNEIYGMVTVSNDSQTTSNNNQQMKNEKKLALSLSQSNMFNSEIKSNDTAKNTNLASFKEEPMDYRENAASMMSNGLSKPSQTALRGLQHNHTYMSNGGEQQLSAAESLLLHPYSYKNKLLKKKLNESTRSANSSVSNATTRQITRDEILMRKHGISQLTLNQVIHTDADEFNELVKEHGLTADQLTVAKDIRRRGKNKVAAQICRKRKIDSIESLRDDVKKLKDKTRLLDTERNEIEIEIKNMNRQFDEMYKSMETCDNPNDPIMMCLQTLKEQLNLNNEKLATINQQQRDYVTNKLSNCDDDDETGEHADEDAYDDDDDDDEDDCVDDEVHDDDDDDDDDENSFDSTDSRYQKSSVTKSYSSGYESQYSSPSYSNTSYSPNDNSVRSTHKRVKKN